MARLVEIFLCGNAIFSRQNCWDKKRDQTIPFNDIWLKQINVLKPVLILLQQRNRFQALLILQ